MRYRNYALAIIFASLQLVLVGIARGDDTSEAIEAGNEAFHRGQYEQAIFLYRGVLAWHGPHQARAYFNIGVSQYRLGRLREAVVEYREAIRYRNGRYPAASYALGIALEKLGESEEALEAF
ncbi:MAG: tetratricopeptide repeat protein, partial [Blastocatellia bacterium]|nr:tetratricopeptide repeat protein [Blastocatellia bacterium]